MTNMLKHIEIITLADLDFDKIDLDQRSVNMVENTLTLLPKNIKWRVIDRESETENPELCGEFQELIQDTIPTYAGKILAEWITEESGKNTIHCYQGGSFEPLVIWIILGDHVAQCGTCTYLYAHNTNTSDWYRSI